MHRNKHTHTHKWELTYAVLPLIRAWANVMHVHAAACTHTNLSGDSHWLLILPFNTPTHPCFPFFLFFLCLLIHVVHVYPLNQVTRRLSRNVVNQGLPTTWMQRHSLTQSDQSLTLFSINSLGATKLVWNWKRPKKKSNSQSFKFMLPHNVPVVTSIQQRVTVEGRWIQAGQNNVFIFSFVFISLCHSWVSISWQNDSWVGHKERWIIFSFLDKIIHAHNGTEWQRGHWRKRKWKGKEKYNLSAIFICSLLAIILNKSCKYFGAEG